MLSVLLLWLGCGLAALAVCCGLVSGLQGPATSVSRLATSSYLQPTKTDTFLIIDVFGSNSCNSPGDKIKYRCRISQSSDNFKPVCHISSYLKCVLK